MTRTLVIARREIFAFFMSPIAYVAIVCWLLWSGVSYALLCENYTMTASMREPSVG